MGRARKTRLLVLTATGVLALGCTVVRAQDEPGDAQRAVARISLMDGQVSVQRGDSGDWVAGVINAPLLSDDRISTAPNSRAEVQFDSSNILRIGGNALVRLTDLEYGRYQMELAHGTVTYRVLRPSTANVEVDTPSIAVHPSKEGTYRITVKDNGETEVTARAGDVEVFTPRGSQWVSAGQTMEARGPSSDPEFQIAGAIPPDDWDAWNEARDRALLQSTSVQYVAPGVYGTEDLDQYGVWSEVAPYGYCWHPTAVTAGWAPYQAGRWVWLDWYGWTWVSYDPWGWAPYHYGRWFYSAPVGWCWYPGVFGVRHYWSPALVAWFGFGGGGGFGFGFGNIGWVPLAPYEVYHPWWGRGFYGHGGGFYQNLQITNLNVMNHYRNARVANGITAVGTDAFHNGRFTGMRHLSGRDIGAAGVVRGGVPVGPSAASLHYGARQASYVPRASGNTRFFTHERPAAPARVSFAQQRAGFEQAARGGAFNRGGTAAAAQGQSGWRRVGEPRTGSEAIRNDRPAQAQQSSGGWNRSGGPAVRQAAPRGAESERGSAGWGRFGEPGGSATAPRSAAPQRAPEAAPQTNRGWSRFGDPGTSYSGGPRTVPRSEAWPRSEPRSAPSYSAPRSSAPRSHGGGGGGYSAPRSSGGGRSSGGSRSSGGGSRGSRR